MPAGLRQPAAADRRVNDTTLERGGPRVTPTASAAKLGDLLAQVPETGWPVLVIGPPAVDDEEQNERSAVLDVAFARVCAQHQVPYVGVLPALREHQVWRRQVREGDGAHPGAEGYEALAALLLPAWRAWLAFV